MLAMVINWDVDPNLVEVGPLTIRWYGLLFAVAFLSGHYVLSRIFRKEGIQQEWLDKVLVYTIVGTIIGARLGHVFFYGWDYYSQHLEEIPQIWKGGLASHGGAIGIILALWVYSRRVTHRPLLWILDRVVTPIALGGMFIRLGNLMNSEIVGEATDAAWGFVFHRLNEVPPVPRHPAQLYESVAYLFIFVILLGVYSRTNAPRKHGFMFGLFLVLVFAARFFLEFFKRNQTLPDDVLINMGQWLSIPFVLTGTFFLFRGHWLYQKSRMRNSVGNE